MTGMRPLPEEGADLLQELRACQSYWVEQALRRTSGNRSAAAKLLGTDEITLDWLRRVLAPTPQLSAGHINRRSSIRPRSSRPAPLPPSEAPTLRDLPKHREPSRVDPAELGRIERGVLKIDPAVIRRLAGEGFTAKEISRQLGVHFNFVEKVLREGGPT